MMRVPAPHSNITLNITSNLILLNKSITILDNQYTFLIILIYLIATNSRKRFLLNFNPGLSIKANQMIIIYYCFIILTLY